MSKEQDYKNALQEILYHSIEREGLSLDEEQSLSMIAFLAAGYER